MALGARIAAVVVGMGTAVASAQPSPQRPDAGTLQERQRVIPTLPQPGGPRIEAPAPAPAPQAPSVELVPAGFRFRGNTVFADEVLQRIVAPRAGKRTDLAGLQQAAREVREFYQDHGFLLTDAFIPEQALAREGGVVSIEVVEARVGQVTLNMEGGEPAGHLFAMIRRALPAGSHASEYALDLPVLLARDLAGHDATASIQPGSRPGEVDVIVNVRAQPRRDEWAVSLDNHGVRTAGQWRATASLETSNLTGAGDALGVRLQVAEITASRLYRVAYSRPLATAGTRATFTLARSEYALGGAFEALGANGHADIAGVSLLHPLLRGRTNSVYATASLELKRLDDKLAAGPDAHRRLQLARLGVAGNRVDEYAGGGALTSYAAGVAFGRLRLDATSAAVDAGPGGLGTEGDFAKLNVEVQRTQFLTPRLSVAASLQAQWAFDNLTSAEKMTLGGPSGVRAYPSGEAVGDLGALASVEVRYQLIPAEPFPVAVGLFYDAGRVRVNRHPTTTAVNSRSLSGAGLSLQAGAAGRFQAAAALAWRVGSERPSGGEPDRSPRLWLTTQAWF